MIGLQPDRFPTRHHVFCDQAPAYERGKELAKVCPGSSADGRPGLPVSGPGHTYPPSPRTAPVPGDPRDHARHRRLLVQQGQDRLVVRVRCKGAGRHLRDRQFLEDGLSRRKIHVAVKPCRHPEETERERGGAPGEDNEKRAPGWRAAISITWLHTESTVVGSSVRCSAGIPSESARSCARVIPFRNATFAARSCVVSPVPVGDKQPFGKDDGVRDSPRVRKGRR